MSELKREESKSESLGVDQEGSTARTEAPASKPREWEIRRILTRYTDERVGKELHDALGVSRDDVDRDYLRLLEEEWVRRMHVRKAF